MDISDVLKAMEIWSRYGPGRLSVNNCEQHVVVVEKLPTSEHFHILHDLGWEYHPEDRSWTHW